MCVHRRAFTSPAHGETYADFGTEGGRDHLVSERVATYVPASHDADAVKLPGDTSSVVVPEPPLTVKPPHDLVNVRSGHHDRPVVAQVQPSSL